MSSEISAWHRGNRVDGDEREKQPSGETFRKLRFMVIWGLLESFTT